MLPIRKTIHELPASRIREATLAGRDIAGLIPLWYGEGDDVTPAFIRDAAAEAMHRGETFYTANRGITELRDAIQRYLRRIYLAEVDLDRIVVSASGMNALMIAVQCLVQPGDSAIVIGPVWPNAENAIAALGAEVRGVDLQALPDGNWHLDLQRIRDACDATTRLIVINSPGNPTGWMATQAELQSLLELALAKRPEQRYAHAGQMLEALLALPRPPVRTKTAAPPVLRSAAPQNDVVPGAPQQRGNLPLIAALITGLCTAAALAYALLR